MFPLRTDAPTGRTPVLLVILVVTALVFAYQTTLDAHERTAFIGDWALIPSTLWPSIKAGIPWDEAVRLITSAFLHGGWLHVLLNGWTLWLFGRSVEATLGSPAFIGLYLGTAIVSALTHVAVFPDDATPVIGASGAVAGILGAFVRLYPSSHVLLVVPIVVLPVWFHVPALTYVGVWMAVQLLQGVAMLGSPVGESGIAWWVHVGGAVAGYAAAGFLPRRTLGRAGMTPGAGWRVGRWGRSDGSGHWGPRPPTGDRDGNQKPESGCFRNSVSSGVLSRPRIALRCGKRPKRATMSRCALAYFS